MLADEAEDELNAEPEEKQESIFDFLEDSDLFFIDETEELPEPEEIPYNVFIEVEEEPHPTRAARTDGGLFYDFAYSLGIRVMRASRHVLKRIVSILKKPAHVIVVFASITFLLLDKFALRSYRASVDEYKKLKGDIAAARMNIARQVRLGPKSFLKVLIHYPSAAYKAHPRFFKTFANYALPALAVIIFAFTVARFSSATYALEVILEVGDDRRSIGYISDEAVYLEAREIVKQKLSSDNEVTDGELIATPTYKVTKVKLSQLSDADAISDRIVENSAAKLTSACGVYIDGEFLCSVKNETDARSVFDDILYSAEDKAKIDRTDGRSFADFVEEIEYVQGLYPDSEETMWDAARLKDKLENEKKQAEIHYTVKDGDTPSEVADDYDISTSELMRLNPGVNFKVFRSGTELLISAAVSYVRVEIIKVVEATVKTPFETEIVYDSSRFSGYRRTTREGVKGEDKVVWLVTYVDGVETKRSEISRTVISEPRSEKVKVGTKKTTVSGSYSYKVTTTNSRFVWPCSGLYTITSQYGYRKSGFHTGVDISGGSASGKIVLAADSGTVELVKRSSSGYGNQIVINHGGGVKTRYAHLLSGSISVSTGQKVSQGQAIARVGNTGNSTGPHLHFEVIVGGNTVNPMKYLKK